MTDITRLKLRRTLVDGYARFSHRLTQRLGSPSLASEVLNETWIMLGQGGELEEVGNADAYIYRAALNVAGSLRKREQRHAGQVLVAELPDVADDAPLPDSIVASREEMDIFAHALNELPPRQREAFIECYRGETPPELLAAKHQVSVRTIQADIRSAILHCAGRLGRKNVLAGKRVKLSGT